MVIGFGLGISEQVGVEVTDRRFPQQLFAVAAYI